MEMEATPLRHRRWAVRPAGQVGTHGWVPKPWYAIHVTASTAEEALRKAAAKQAEVVTRPPAINRSAT